jgi:hypothetical protein
VRDDNVPGHNAVTLPARSAPGEDWASAASVPLPELRKGGRLTAILWARADHAVDVPLSLQAKEAPYASFGHLVAHLTHAWQRVEIRGTAPSTFEAASQLLSVQLGKAPADVLLGPALLVSGML